MAVESSPKKPAVLSPAMVVITLVPADPADPVVARIGNVDQPGVHIDAGRCIQPGQGGGAVVTEKPTGAGSGDGADSSCCADPSNPVVSGVGDIYQSRRIDKNGSWGIELGVGSGTVVAGKTRRSSARDGGDRIAGGVDSANNVVSGVGDV